MKFNLLAILLLVCVTYSAAQYFEYYDSAFITLTLPPPLPINVVVPINIACNDIACSDISYVRVKSFASRLSSSWPTMLTIKSDMILSSDNIMLTFPITPALANLYSMNYLYKANIVAYNKTACSVTFNLSIDSVMDIYGYAVLGLEFYI